MAFGHLALGRIFKQEDISVPSVPLLHISLPDYFTDFSKGLRVLTLSQVVDRQNRKSPMTESCETAGPEHRRGKPGISPKFSNGL